MPTPTLITLDSTTAISTVLSQTVYAKEKWEDDWVAQTHIVCTSATWAAAPSMGDAELYYRYGPGVFPGETVGTYLLPYSLPDLAYVRIDFELQDDVGGTELREWHGVVGSLVDVVYGSDVTTPDGSTRIKQGKQTLNAVGLAWLLDRQYVNRSWWTKDEVAKTETRVGLPFNLLGGQLHANRSNNFHDTPGTEFTRIFKCDDTTDDAPDFWSTKDIVHYLLSWHMGRTASDVVFQKWGIADPSGQIPDWDSPVLEAHGSRVWQLLNQLIPRQRGYSFYLEVENSDDPGVAKIVLKPFTFTKDDVVISLDPLKVIYANPNQFRLDATNDQTIGGVPVVSDAFAEYDQVRVTGNRAVHCFSLDFDAISGDVESDWESSDQTAYDEGASNDAGYPVSAEIAERQRLDVEARQRPSLHAVYRRFKLKADWDFKSSAIETVFPDYEDPEANPEGVTRKLPYNELVILPFIPLFPGVDYTSFDAIDDPTVKPEFMKPQVWFAKAGSDYVNGDSIKVSQHVEGEDEDRNYHFSVELNPLKEPGKFHLDVHGQAQHVIASQEFTPLAHEWEIGGFDFSTVYITIAVNADYYCQSVYPPIDDIIAEAPTKLIRILDINAGPDFRMDLIIKDTYLKLTSQTTFADADSTYLIRDDRPTLTEIAKLAHVWYGSTRRALTFETKLITAALQIGDMITGLVSEPAGLEATDTEVNTVVTSITITNRVGVERAEPAAMKYQTEAAELDAISYFQ